MAENVNSLADQGFYRHAPSIWIRQPVPSVPFSSISTENEKHTRLLPSLLLLFSWTGASLRHVAKYTAWYASVFPDAPIMLITSTLRDLTFRSKAHKQAVLAPAVSYITSHSLDTNGIHIHSFSDGGSHKATQLAAAYLSTTGNHFPLSSMCLDSTPSAPRIHRTAHAFSLSLPPRIPFIRILGRLFAYLVLSCIWCFYIILGPDLNIITQLRQSLLLDCDQGAGDNQLLREQGKTESKITMKTAAARRRCYLYSEADELVDWKDVESHADLAEKQGLDVLRIRFTKSEHCAHTKEDAKRYWGAVKWALGSEGEGGTVEVSSSLPSSSSSPSSQ